MQKTIGLVIACGILAVGCSHSKTKDIPGSVDAAPEPSGTPLELTNASGLTQDDYLKQIVLPKITQSKIVNQCLLSDKRITKKERKKGILSFQFELRLVSLKEKVYVSQVYLSSSQNLPEWAKPCVIANYKKFVFPKFPDPKTTATTAFGNVNMSWKP